MDDEAKLELMKDRIVKTYVCQRDIILPLSEDFNSADMTGFFE